EPNLMGRRLGLSTLVVVLSLIFWGWVWGPIGALLSVPLTMVLKIVLENTPDLRWAAVLLDKMPPQARHSLHPRRDAPRDGMPEAGAAEEARGMPAVETGSPAGAEEGAEDDGGPADVAGLGAGASEPEPRRATG
ncbi:MAG TPA: AI-2E family transporter, partial [Longimicrobiales bacterium]|nr:AI-2E family transporter [Longimicrobiales bacterium]